jgi:molybdopterin-guanine dinucleotide biosynthesis protein A
VSADALGPLTGVVLAGGRAERMGGRDKGLLELAGEPLVAHAIRQLRSQVAEVLISANRNLARYRRFGCRVVRDGETERYRGPLAGVLAAMRAATTSHLLIAPCDSPLLPPDYARQMRAALARERASLAVVCREGFRQPVFALLPVALRDDLAAYLAAGGGGAGRWLAAHRPALVEFSGWPAAVGNVNTPEDLARLEADWKVEAGRPSTAEAREHG